MEEKKPKSRYKAIKVNGVKHDEHRYLMEQHLGYKLSSDMVVHHKNEKSRDNDISNLEVMTRAEHARLHQLGRIYPKEVIDRRPSRVGYISEYNRSQRKLTEDDVRFIRDNYKPHDKEFGARPMAKKFNIDHSSLIKIANRKCYSDID